MSTTVTSTQVELSAERATDWLLRRVLPEFLICAGHSHSARILAALPEVTREQVQNRYALVRTAGLLRNLRAQLATSLRDEVAMAQAEAVSLSVVRLGGPIAMRERFFPNLDHVTAFVRKAHERTGFGSLLQACIDTSINLVMTGYDNDRIAVAGGVPACLARGYETAQRALIAIRTAPLEERQHA